MEGSCIKKVFAEGDFPFDRVEQLLVRLRDIDEGYILARWGRERRYLFSIARRLYCGGRVAGKDRGLTGVGQFFTWYRDAAKADVAIYRADKKLLFCFMVMLGRSPTQAFSTATIAIEDVLKDVESSGEDRVMTLLVDGRLAFAIFLSGRLACLFLPEGAYVEGSARRQVLEYASMHRQPISIELYSDIVLRPADDAVGLDTEGFDSLLSGLKDRLTEHRGAGAEESVPLSTAYLQMPDGSKKRLGSITTIGKDEQADIRISGLFAAKRQVVIIKGRDIYKVVRKGGLSPLRINGESMDEKVLQDGDTIEVAGLSMVFRIEAKGGTDV